MELRPILPTDQPPAYDLTQVAPPGDGLRRMNIGPGVSDMTCNPNYPQIHIHGANFQNLEEFLSILRQYHTLHILDIDNCLINNGPLTDVEVNHIVDLLNYNYTPSLQYMSLNQTACTFEQINLPKNLISLDISQSTRLTDAGVVNILTKANQLALQGDGNLRSLNLSNTPIRLENVAFRDHYTGISSLDCSGCSSLTYDNLLKATKDTKMYDITMHDAAFNWFPWRESKLKENIYIAHKYRHSPITITH